MTARVVACLLALVLMAGCGGDDGNGGGGGNGGEESTKTLEFEQVERFTVEYGGAESERNFTGCENASWGGPGAQTEKRAEGVFGATRAEVFGCVPDTLSGTAVYLEFEDAATAREQLATPACAPEFCSVYLVAEKTAVLTAFADVEEGRPYLEALKAECGCGEVVTAEPAE